MWCEVNACHNISRRINFQGANTWERIESTVVTESVALRVFVCLFYWSQTDRGGGGGGGRLPEAATHKVISVARHTLYTVYYPFINKHTHRTTSITFIKQQNLWGLSLVLRPSSLLLSLSVMWKRGVSTDCQYILDASPQFTGGTQTWAKASRFYSR